MNKELIEEFIEQGADLEHDRWARWQKYMFSKMTYTEYKEDGKTFAAYILPADLWERWSRQIDTAYKDLPEEEKESDRKETRNYLPLVDKALTQVREQTIQEIEDKLPKELKLEAIKGYNEEKNKLSLYLSQTRDYNTRCSIEIRLREIDKRIIELNSLKK